MRLKDYLLREGTTAREFGQRVDASSHAVEKWMRGERMPRPAQMHRIVEETGGAVTANDFYGIGPSEPSSAPPAASEAA